MDRLINSFSIENLKAFFMPKGLKPVSEDLSYVLSDNQYLKFSDLLKLGEITFSNSEDLLIFTCKYNGELTKRSSKKKQFEIAKKVLKEDFKDGAIFVFYDNSGCFRFSFIRKNVGEKEKYSSWKRYTYFIEPDKKTNNTFKNQIGKNCDFKSLDSIQKAFSVEELTKNFYKELFKWYEWALTGEVGITFPNDTTTSEDDRIKLEEQIIRLITRVLFVWFIKQKQLVPGNFFNTEELSSILKNFDPYSSTEGNYYNAILQNLFFATLNRAVTEREFAKVVDKRDIKTRYRYAEMFSLSSEEEIINLFHPVPFLNGGLFECLDKEESTDGVKYHLDGFSRSDKRSANGNFKHRAFIPNCVFFDNEKGLIPLLERYNFTVEENSPNEIQIALDPELLGNVFENLLGAFNPETKESARKQSGSFYTPKEIVAYMVDESLITYLTQKLPNVEEDTIRLLFEQEQLPELISKDENLRKEIVNHLQAIKILDPACGSGAFPMGILNRMVQVLEKLEKKNKETLYDLKLHLIEECIYGIDIQTIAVQISKLRFFISLIVEQEKDDTKDNYGIIPLPNLETKFVAANTLIGIKNENNHLLDLTDSYLKDFQQRLLEIRHQHFYAKSTSEKIRLRKQDEELREKIIKYLSENSVQPDEEKIQSNLQQIEKLQLQRKSYETENWIEDTQKAVQTSMFDDQPKQISIFRVDLNEKPRGEIDRIIKVLQQEIQREQSKSKKIGFEDTVEKIAKWNPYDQNASSSFFDLEWMFGLDDGFDVVIGNPPYIQLQKENGKLAKLYQDCNYKTFAKKGDIYSLFYERGSQLLKQKGLLCYITSNKWMRAGYGESTRKFFIENTNPILLIDFAGQKIFDSATVDTNILLFSKDKNRQETKACIIKEKVLNNLSDYFRKNNNETPFNTSESWVVLSPIEKQIKDKIERIGTPLKEWDIRINYGIKTGFNDAFIIDGAKRKELIEQDSKSEEIIRPILRGRDIKCYSYEFADLYIITTFPSLKIDIEQYPAINQHLLSFGYDRLKQTGDKGARKKTNNKWFETQDSISYWEDFSKPKIIYPNMTKYMPFYLDNDGFVVNQKCFIITGEKLAYLTAFFNSKVFKICYRDCFPELQGGTRELSKIFFEVLKIPNIIDLISDDFEILVRDIQDGKDYADLRIEKAIIYALNLNEFEDYILNYHI